MSDIITKRSIAIRQVKSNLNKYRNILYETNSTVVEKMPSFSTSLIKVNLDKSFSKNDSRILNVIQEVIDNETLIKNYNTYISTLDAVLSKIISEKYINGYSIESIFSELNMDPKKAYLYLNKAYVIIAVLDREINYTIEDYIEYQMESHKFDYSIRETVKLLINHALTDKNDIKSQYTISILKELTIEQTEALAFLNNNVEQINMTSYQYCKLQQAIYSFAYLHKDISFNYDTYEFLMKKTKKGYKKIITQINKVKMKRGENNHGSI